ncbi:MAG: 4-(cytidine 5'-diphospho)-2-C-methyl-D-erythritol kinase [Phycisphaerales bacterium]
MQPPKPLTLNAHAKVNLVLLVAPKRTQDGLHPICSWMHPIELHDQIRLERIADTQESRFEILWHNGQAVDWAIEDDLAVRAHRLMERAAGRSLPIDLQIVKNIPAGGGLGGGSSDTASVLLGLNTLFDLGMTHEQLVRVGLEIGSDVPFFLDHESIHTYRAPRPAIVAGIGDRVDRLEREMLSGRALTLIVPPFGCHTGRVYRAFDALVDSGEAEQADGPGMRQRVRSIMASSPLESSSLCNALAPAAEHVEPRLGELRRAIERQTGRPVHVSGSGSTLMLLDRQEVDDLLDGTHDGVRVVQTVLM